jgi:hypothetical protein
MKKALPFLLASLLFLPSLSLSAQSAKPGKGTAAGTTPTPEMFVANNILHVRNAPEGAKLQIITIVGNKVREIEIPSTEVAYELNLPKAIYIFKLEGMVRKFVIK